MAAPLPFIPATLPLLMTTPPKTVKTRQKRPHFRQYRPHLCPFASIYGDSAGIYGSGAGIGGSRAGVAAGEKPRRSSRRQSTAPLSSCALCCYGIGLNLIGQRSTAPLPSYALHSRRTPYAVSGTDTGLNILGRQSTAPYPPTHCAAMRLRSPYAASGTDICVSKVLPAILLRTDRGGCYCPYAPPMPCPS